jgi:hypothetical protein
MHSPTLDQTQQIFWKLITAPEGVAAGLAGLPPAERALGEALVCGDARLSAVERLDIYADMYFYRIRDCLKEDFTAVCAVIGGDAFHNLITDYLMAHPPTQFSLRYAGQHLPAFVRGHALAARWSYLPDLAALEWAILDAFDALDAEPLGAAALASVPQERWPELRFQLTPSLRLLRLDWPVDEVWKQAQRDEPAGQLQPASTTLRVWRQDLRVFHRPMDAAESAALNAVSAGAQFADVCERIVACEGEAHGAERALALLGEWLADGLLTGLRFE